MPVNVIGTLKPKNNGKFPVAEAVDIKVTEDLRLDEALENKADLSTVNFSLDQKADKTTAASLQGQINQIVISSSAEAVVAPEVAAARTSANGVEFTTLKGRIDSTEDKASTGLLVVAFDQRGWINAENGVYTAFPEGQVNSPYSTPYISINGITELKYKVYVAVTGQTATAGLAFYTSTKSFISAVTLVESGVASGIAVIPANAAYVRACNWYNDVIEEPICYLYATPETITSMIASTKSDIEAEVAASNKAIDNAVSVGNFTEEGWINAATGAFSALSNSYATPFIPTAYYSKIKYKVAVTVTAQASSAALAFYDSSKHFISAITLEEAGTAEGTATIPAGAAYFRAANWLNEVASPECYMSMKPDLIKSEFDSIRDEINSLVISDNVEFTTNGYLTGAGNFVSSELAKICDYKEIHNTSNKIHYKLYSNDASTDNIDNKIGLVTFYTSGKHKISTFYNTGITGFAEGEISIPSNAVYYRATKWKIAGNDDNYCGEGYSVTSAIDNLDDRTTILENKVSKLEDNPVSYWNADSLNKPFDFDSKAIVSFGDSITIGVASPNLQVTTPFIKQFADHAGASLTNNAVSGSSITDITNATSIYSKIMDYSGDTDFIIIAGGTNDWNTSKEIGTFDDVLDTTDATTVTLYSCMKAICDHLAQKTATVIFITPIPYTQAYIDDHSDVNSLSYTLNDYRKAIYEVATSYGFNVVDGASLGMPTGKGGWNNAMCDDSDGCHPTVAGHQLYARNLAGKLL